MCPTKYEFYVDENGRISNIKEFNKDIVIKILDIFHRKGILDMTKKRYDMFIEEIMEELNK